MSRTSDHCDHLGGLLEQNPAGEVDRLHNQLDQAWQPGAGQSIKVSIIGYLSTFSILIQTHLVLLSIQNGGW